MGPEDTPSRALHAILNTVDTLCGHVSNSATVLCAHTVALNTCKCSWSWARHRVFSAAPGGFWFPFRAVVTRLSWTPSQFPPEFHRAVPSVILSTKPTVGLGPAGHLSAPGGLSNPHTHLSSLLGKGADIHGVGAQRWNGISMLVAMVFWQKRDSEGHLST